MWTVGLEVQRYRGFATPDSERRVLTFHRDELAHDRDDEIRFVE
jgi:hypothetical protein